MTSSPAGDRPPAPPLPLPRWIRAVRNRCLLHRWLTAVLAGLFAVLGGIGLWLVRGMPPHVLAGLSLGPLALALGIATGIGVLGALGLRLRRGQGARRALRRLAPRDPALAEEAWSAWELGQGAAELPPAARVFERCHRARVEQGLARHPPVAVVPGRFIGPLSRGVALMVVAVAAGLWLTPEAPRQLVVQLGLAPEVDTLPRVLPGAAARVDQVRVRPPRYTGLSETTTRVVNGPITVPLGARVAVVAHARRDVDEVLGLRAWLPGGGRGAGERLGERTVRVRFTAHQGGSLALALRTHTGWQVGTGLLAVRVTADQPPVIRVTGETPQRLETPASVPVRWEALDDHGLTAVRLVFRVDDGPEVKRPLGAGPRFGAQRKTRLAGTYPFDLRRLRLRVGSRVRFHLVAVDNRSLGDAEGGPQHTATAEQVIRIVGRVSERQALLAQVRQVFEASVTRLGDRLVAPDPAAARAPEACLTQLQTLRGLARAEGQLLDDLERLLAEARKRRDGLLPVLRDALEGPVTRVKQRLRRIADPDRAALQRAMGRRGAALCVARRLAATRQERLVPELEELVLQLDALVARAILEEMRDRVDRIEQLRKQIQRLAEQLRQQPSAADRRRLERLMTELRRLLSEVSQLAGSLGDEQVDQHVNRYAMERQAQRRLLDKLQRDGRHKAPSPGDLSALDRLVQGLRQAVREGVDRFRRVVPLPGERARQRQSDALRELLRAQRQLNRRLRQAGRGEGLQKAQRDLARKARQLSQKAPPKNARGQRGSPAVGVAAKHMERAADALARGEWQEAKKHGRRAARALQRAAREAERSGRVSKPLDLSAGDGDLKDGKVEIPPAGGALPRALRKAIQQGGRTGWPAAYREPLRRYYERLLR